MYLSHDHGPRGIEFRECVHYFFQWWNDQRSQQAIPSNCTELLKNCELGRSFCYPQRMDILRGLRKGRTVVVLSISTKNKEIHHCQTRKSLDHGEQE